MTQKKNKDHSGIYDSLRGEIAKVIVGQADLIDLLLIALLSEGHVLINGLPGLAKTLMIKAAAKASALEFSRIQFTPDLLPSDLLGYEFLDEQKKEKFMKFVKGPVFTNILLADEINRTPPKTQSALLQAMQEKEVTVAGIKYNLPYPFLVMATQNPIEQEGTYPLPEAQLDRFMFMLNISYPSLKEEILISQSVVEKSLDLIAPVFGSNEYKKNLESVQAVKIAPEAVEWAVRLIHATRPQSGIAGDLVREYVSCGASPRASKHIINSSKTAAFLDGSCCVSRHHMLKVIRPVLRHRVFINFAGIASNVTPDSIIDECIKTADR